jgi:hypothetical protein
MSQKKDMEQFVKRARRHGWRVELTNGGHYKFFPINGNTPIIAPSSPSGIRSIANTKSRLKKAGLPLS